MKRFLLCVVIFALFSTGASAPQLANATSATAPPAHGNSSASAYTIGGVVVGLGILCLLHVGLCPRKLPNVQDGLVALEVACGLQSQSWWNRGNVRQLGTGSSVYPSQIYTKNGNDFSFVTGEAPFTKYLDGTAPVPAPGTLPLLMSSTSGACATQQLSSSAGATVINAVFGGATPIAAALNSTLASASSIIVRADDIYSAAVGTLDLQTYYSNQPLAVRDAAFSRNNVTIQQEFFADNVSMTITASSSVINTLAVSTGTSTSGASTTCTASALPSITASPASTVPGATITATPAPVLVSTASPVPATTTTPTPTPTPSGTTPALPGSNSSLPVNGGLCQAGNNAESITFTQPGPVQLVATFVHLAPLPAAPLSTKP